MASSDFDGSNIVYDAHEGADSPAGNAAEQPSRDQGGASTDVPEHDDADAQLQLQGGDNSGVDVASHGMMSPQSSQGGQGMNSMVPSAAELQSLEREVEALTQSDVEALLAFLADYYTIDLVRLSTKEGKDQPSSPQQQQQQQIVSDILRVEGCAQCLIAHPYEQDEAARQADASKGPEGAATARVANDAFILLGCKLLHCKHVLHVLCVLKLQAKLRAAAAAAANGVVSKMILPTLDLCHSTSFFRVIAFPIGTQSVRTVSCTRLCTLC
jgi:hypothetical protein